MGPQRHLHVIHLLIRSQAEGSVRFLLYPHDKWKDAEGKPFWTLPVTKTVADPFAPVLQGRSVEHFLETVMEQELGLAARDYALEQELKPVQAHLISPRDGTKTEYTNYPADVWVDARRHDDLKVKLQGDWFTCDEALALRELPLSPTTAAVLRLVREREARLDRCYQAEPQAEHQPDAERRLLRAVGDAPSMNALARKWLNKNRGGVRHLPKTDLDAILAAGDRAFNLRVADPYLRYQLQGVGFTWSFFTHADPQDLHVHGAPTVEIYGILEGRLEIWWKAYHDRGTSAWCRRVLETGDWLEVEALQCHIVHWLGPGKGVVFKAGPGPLAEVGRLGVKGKTPCRDCPCMKPPDVEALNRPSAKG